jgi:hypothetical protein
MEVAKKLMPTPQLECLIARTPEHREQVYRLRYECYRRDQSINLRDDRKFSDSFDEMPNSFSFLVRTSDEQALATVRISVVRPEEGWRDSPVQHVFGDHPTLQSFASGGFVEASRLCFAQQARRDAFVRLVGHMAALASFYEVEWLVACPRVEHATSYQRMFGFKPIAPPRPYFGVGFQTQLLATRREEIDDYVRNATPMRNAWSDALAQLVRSNAMPMLSTVCSRAI